MIVGASNIPASLIIAWFGILDREAGSVASGCLSVIDLKRVELRTDHRAAR